MRDWTTTGVIGEGEGGERGLNGSRDRVVRKTTAGDETRRPKMADASGDAPRAGREAAAMLRRSDRRVAIEDGVREGEWWLCIVRDVVEGVVVVVVVVGEEMGGRALSERRAKLRRQRACLLSLKCGCAHCADRSHYLRFC